MDNIIFRDAGGFAVTVTEIIICGVPFTPQHLLEYLWQLEALNDQPSDCAAVLVDLLRKDQISDMSFVQALTAARAAQKAGQS